MNKKNAMASFETDEDAREAGYATKLKQHEAKVLYPVNRKERRAELARMRIGQREHNKP